MKPIEKDEIFENLREFLKTRGIELKDGSYSNTINKSCRILADVINLGQQGLTKAKDGIDRKLDAVRQCIHEKTAPKSSGKTGSAAADTAEPDTAAESASASSDTTGVKPSAEAGKANGKARQPKPKAAHKPTTAKSKSPKKKSPKSPASA